MEVRGATRIRLGRQDACRAIPSRTFGAANLHPTPQAMVFANAHPRTTSAGSNPQLGEIYPVRRVVVATPLKLYGETLAMICQRVFADVEVTLHGRGFDALKGLRKRPADLLVMGLTFPDVDGLDLLDPIAHERLAARVLVDSPRSDQYTLLALRTARFDGYIDGSSEGVEAMDAALRAVADGRGYISPARRSVLVERQPANSLARLLTPAEIRVLSIVGDGSDDHEAAARLRLSPTTIQTHRRNIMRKLGVSTSSKLVREAVRLGVVRINPRGVVLRAHPHPRVTDRVGKQPAKIPRPELVPSPRT